jgi:superfamily II DNA or RNA helicase
LAALEELKENLYPNAYIYLLSATLSFNNQYRAEEVFGKFATSTVTLKKAIQKDILADPKIYIVALELDDSKVNQEILVNKADSNSPKVSWEDRMQYLTKKKPCIIQCTEKQKYIYYTNTMEYWKQRYERSKNQFQRNLWVNTGSKRKRFLGELKTGAVEQLLNIIPDNMKTVCFCTTISQAESFSANKTLSSKKSSKWNQAIIEEFNKGLIRRIYAIGMITEGMNLNGIKVGIITQLDGTERLFIQKQGRVMRSEDPVSFIFYYKNTQDENYLKKALENVDTKYIQYVNINQLKTIKL